MKKSYEKLKNGVISYLNSKEGDIWLEENAKKLNQDFLLKKGIFSKEEDELWEPYLTEE